MLEDDGKWQCEAENTKGYIENGRPIQLVVLGMYILMFCELIAIIQCVLSSVWHGKDLSTLYCMHWNENIFEPLMRTEN